jgi:hypothetical protein
MDFYLNRRYKGPLYTIGDIVFEKGVVLCNSLEPPVRELKDLNGDGDFLDPGEGKVPNQTAIEPGRYRVDIVYFPVVKRNVVRLNGIYGFSGVLIHAGKTVANTHACILPGINDVKGQVSDSKHWEIVITNLVEGYIDKGEEVYINVA